MACCPNLDVDMARLAQGSNLDAQHGRCYRCSSALSSPSHIGKQNDIKQVQAVTNFSTF